MQIPATILLLSDSTTWSCACGDVIVSFARMDPNSCGVCLLYEDSTAFPGIYPKETSTMAPPLSFENDTKVKRNPASNLHRIKPVNMGHYSNIPRDEQKHNINSNPVSIMKREGNTNPTE